MKRKSPIRLSRHLAEAGLGALIVVMTAACGAQAETQEQAQDVERLPEDPEALFQDLASDPIELTELVVVDGSQAAIDQLIAQVVSSERVDGWESAGVDITEAIRARPGGLNGNFVLFDSIGEGHGQASFYGEQDSRSFVPSNWVLIATHSQPSFGPDQQVDVASYSRAIKIVARSRSTKVGSARCYRGVDLSVYRDTSAPVTEEDVGLLVGYGSFIRATRDLEMCAYHETSGDRLVYRVVTRDGRKIAALIGDALRGRVMPIADNPFAISR